jgi:hypothetical protein
MKWTVKLVTEVMPGESIEQKVATFVFQTNGLAPHKGDGRGLHLPNNLFVLVRLCATSLLPPADGSSGNAVGTRLASVRGAK